MFPPTHRIYRSIRPRNRFIIGNKRRGLQAVSAICISLILIIYGLENIYTMYDQYDFESQNSGSENRRLTAEAAEPQGRVAIVEDPSLTLKDTALFAATSRGNSDPSYFYSFQDDQWMQLKEPVGDVPTYETIAKPPQGSKISYRPSETILETFRSQDHTPSRDPDIEKHARFTAWQGLFYSLVEDQWGWWKSKQQGNDIHYEPIEQPLRRSTITYVHRDMEHTKPVEFIPPPAEGAAYESHAGMAPGTDTVDPCGKCDHCLAEKLRAWKKCTESHARGPSQHPVSPPLLVHQAAYVESTRAARRSRT